MTEDERYKFFNTAFTMGFFVLLFSFALHAEISVGEESCSFVRMREGGTKQRGEMNGIRFVYNRMKPFYLGADLFFGKAELSGHTGNYYPLNSLLRDRIYEGHIGYCIFRENHFFSLFTGYGYFRETNAFFTSGFLITDTYNYLPIGFLSGVNFNSLLSIGLNVKFMFMQDAHSSVSMPSEETVVLKINEEINARIEVPCIFSPPHTRLGLRFGLIPFYEYRHYGGREGFPYNYIDTQYILFGARVALLTTF